MIGVNANYGSVVISADWDGLLTGEILDLIQSLGLMSGILKVNALYVQVG